MKRAYLNAKINLPERDNMQVSFDCFKTNNHRMKSVILVLVLMFTLTGFSQNTEVLSPKQDSIVAPSKSTTDSATIVSKKRFMEPFKLELALGASASTNGVGGNITIALTNRFAFRLGYEWLDVAINPSNMTVSGQPLVITPNFKSGGLSGIVDFYLLKWLYLSGGVVYSNMNLILKAKSANPVMMEDITFTPDEYGELQFSFNPEHKLSPYLALGFGRNISEDQRFALNFEIGAYYMGSYVANLAGTGLFEGNNQESLANLNETLKNLSWSGFYPVIKLGISYKFYCAPKKTTQKSE